MGVGWCLLNVRLMCTKIRAIFDMCKMFDKNIFYCYFSLLVNICITGVCFCLIGIVRLFVSSEIPAFRIE